jgi:hypothetical protein
MHTTAIKYARVAVSRSLHMSRLGAQFYDWTETLDFSLAIVICAESIMSKPIHSHVMHGQNWSGSSILTFLVAFKAYGAAPFGSISLLADITPKYALIIVGSTTLRQRAWIVCSTLGNGAIRYTPTPQFSFSHAFYRKFGMSEQRTSFSFYHYGLANHGGQH